MTIACTKCDGDGSLYTSRYGGHDPDVWRTGECPECKGSGHQVCDTRGCEELAVGFNEDGEALCEDCLFQWAQAYGDEP